MLFENELIMLVLGLGVSILILRNYDRMKSLPFSKILISGFFSLVIGWVMTILEGFFLKELCNFIEHTCYFLSSMLVAIWSWKAFGKGKRIR